MAISACIQPGAQISMMWMSSRSITERQSVADSAQPYLAAAAATWVASRPTSTFCSKAGTSKKLATFRHAFEWAFPMKA
ncbi:hypothetical protein PJL18_04446 [Paenarthrobacter nicotinovorans]|nr:hypothetical protein [Paenarthrobacter nicotinovorans]